jgi:prevent-host-death family protein
MSGYNKKAVGIKELKDRASEIVATVQQTGRAVSITKNNREVARITPVPKDPRERLVAAGLFRPGPKLRPLSELTLTSPTADATPAIQAILRDREQDGE